MNKEELIKKWLSNDLNATDREAFEALDDSAFNEKIVEDAKRFSASNFSKVDDFDMMTQWEVAGQIYNIPSDADTVQSESNTGISFVF